MTDRDIERQLSRRSMPMLRTHIEVLVRRLAPGKHHHVKSRHNAEESPSVLANGHGALHLRDVPGANSRQSTDVHQHRAARPNRVLGALTAAEAALRAHVSSKETEARAAVAAAEVALLNADAALGRLESGRSALRAIELALRALESAPPPHHALPRVVELPQAELLADRELMLTQPRPGNGTEKRLPRGTGEPGDGARVAE